MEMKSRAIPNVGLHNNLGRKELCQPAPTQEQVDACIRSLERQALLKDNGIPPDLAGKHRGAGKGRRAYAFSGFSWGLLALALGCLTLLLQVIYEALK